MNRYTTYKNGGVAVTFTPEGTMVATPPPAFPKRRMTSARNKFIRHPQGKQCGISMPPPGITHESQYSER